MDAPKTVQRVYFSPTGGTKKILEAIENGLRLLTCQPIDITLPKGRESWNGDVEGDLLLVGVPVYAASYPACIFSTLKKIKGQGKLAVPVAVSGGIYVGDCLGEVTGIIRQQGFTVPAAAIFVAQHGFSQAELPINVGRPDSKDLSTAAEFGRNLAYKLETDRDDVTTMALGRLYLGVSTRGELGSEGSYFPDRYHKDQYVYRSEEVGQVCRVCGICAKVCPTGAIDSVNLIVDDATCTRCSACIRKCPHGLMKKYIDLSSDIASVLRQQARRRWEPQFYM
jgi:ferredoxin